MIDFHNHVLPGVDDGAPDLATAVRALRHFREQGVHTVAVSPHFDASCASDAGLFERRMEELDGAWQALIEAAAQDVPEVELVRGAEIMLDDPAPDLSDERLRIGGTPFVLVEFPHQAIPPGAADLMFLLRRQNLVPVLAHPERYRRIGEAMDQVAEWRRLGVCLQVNSGSILGHYGAAAQGAARDLLQRGWVDYLASDYHSRGIPSLERACAPLRQMGGDELVRVLSEENPSRLLSGEQPMPQPRVKKVGRLRSIIQALVERN